MSAPWKIGEWVEYQNGFGTTVVHVDGKFAVLHHEVGDPRLEAPFDTEPSYILAWGDPEEFCFPHEEAPNVATLAEALAQLEAEKVLMP